MRNGQFPLEYTILMLWFLRKIISTLCFVGNEPNELCSRQESTFFSLRAMRNRQFQLGYTILMLQFWEKSISTIHIVGNQWKELCSWQVIYALEPIGWGNGYFVIECITNHICLYDRGFPSCSYENSTNWMKPMRYKRSCKGIIQ